MIAQIAHGDRNGREGRPIRVVIADDHPVFRRGLVDVLREDASIEIVAEATDGHAALEAVRRTNPDVLVLDIQMPRMTGIDVARSIQLQGLEIPLIFITAFRDEDMFNEALNLGVKGYVLKDSASDDLLAGVKAVAAGNRFISPGLSDFLFERGNRIRDLHRDCPGLDLLTAAERRILRMVALDMTSKEIAEQLGVSHRTVENHRANCALKLNLKGSHSLLRFAFDNKSKLL